METPLSMDFQGAAQSQMNNRAQTISWDEYEFGFAVDWMRKDLSIALTRRKSSFTPDCL